ncbi:MAG: nucleoside deaminase [Elusimicrobia bacterium]|nr:nucleoside deaminase [Elusimicrobiota bacterium]
MNKQEKNAFMEAAVKEAFKGVRGNHGGPFGAVVVQNGIILARAHNKVVSSKDPTAHAEILAIRKTSKILNRFDLSDCEIYSSCEPCPMCLAAILWARIKKIYYGCTRDDAAAIGFDDRVIYEILDIKKEKKHLKKIMLNRERCLQPFKEWTDKTDRITY